MLQVHTSKWFLPALYYFMPMEIKHKNLNHTRVMTWWMTTGCSKCSLYNPFNIIFVLIHTGASNCIFYLKKWVLWVSVFVLICYLLSTTTTTTRTTFILFLYETVYSIWFHPQISRPNRVIIQKLVEITFSIFYFKNSWNKFLCCPQIVFKKSG